jgi:hypothetical protein
VLALNCDERVRGRGLRRCSGGDALRIEIILAPTVPLHLQETLQRCGFVLVRSGIDIRAEDRPDLARLRRGDRADRPGGTAAEGLRRRKVDLIVVGLLWLVLTVAFEFGFFHYVVGKPWDVLLADYNILRGRLWVLVLATVLLGPILVGTILGWGEALIPSSDSGSPSTSEPSR